MTVSGRRKKKWTIASTLILAFLVLVRGNLGLAAAQHQNAKQKKTPSVKEIPMPFAAGETLNYRVSWAAFSTAASLQLSIPERRDLYGWQVWHFRAIAHTLNPVRKLFAVDDQFDSYTDATTLESRQLELHLNELGKAQDEMYRLTTTGKTYPVPGPCTIVQPGTRDPLGAIYSLRAVDWKTTPEIRAPLYDGQNLYDALATRENPNDAVTTASGTYSAARISIRLFQYDKEVTAIRIETWLENAGAHRPVVIEAQLPFGTLRAELTGASTSNESSF